jgi:5-methylcytosine-specific restriction protein A
MWYNSIRCERDRPMSGWSASTRRARLPKDWAKRRRIVLQRDPTCQLRYTGCTGRSTEVDHIEPGDDHRLTNLQGACHPCHARKSALEGAAAKPSRRRAPEPHPGLASRGGG